MRTRIRVIARNLVLGSAFAGVLGAAAPALAGASTNPPKFGYAEICKTFRAGPAGAPMYQGTFWYKLSSGEWSTTVSLNALQGGPQVCTEPLLVPAGTVTVTEKSAPWFSVSSITPTQGDPGTVTPSSSVTGMATLSVNPAPGPGDKSMTTTVQYTNDPVTGVVEVCKRPDANSPSLLGTYNFNVTSQSSDINVYDAKTGAYDLPWSTTASATISSAGLGCSGPITVPAGVVQTVEPGTTFVTAITATSNGSNMLTSPAPNLAQGTSYEVVQAGDTTNQTIVTYTDALSTVKVCKAWTGSPTPTTQFPFTLSSSGAAGPTAVSSSIGLTAGSCQIVGAVRAGTQVNITEGIVVGTKVASIGVSPTSNSQGMSPIVPGSLSLPNRTIRVIAGAGETTVTYTDMAADPGTLKICLMPTDNAAAGTVPFTVNGTQTINVNLSSTALQCTLDPVPFAFNSKVTIAGGALPPSDRYMGSPTVVPTNVEVLEGGVPTPTNQATLVASTSSSASVLMSEGIVTEVTFMIDPPAPETAPPVTVVAPVLTSGPAPVLIGATQGTSSPVVFSPSTSQSAAVTSQVSAKIARIERRLISVKHQIKAVQKKLASHHLSKAARKADHRRLTQLRATERSLTRQLRK